MSKHSATPPQIKVNGHVYVRADEFPTGYQSRNLDPHAQVVMSRETTEVANAIDRIHMTLDALNKQFNQTQPQPHTAPLVQPQHVSKLKFFSSMLRQYANELDHALAQIK